MTPYDEQEILRLLREARATARGYSDYFSWQINRELEEVGVVVQLCESLEQHSATPIQQIASRGAGNDPPDCEAIDEHGNRVAIEVTELVDTESLRAFKRGNLHDWAEWSEEKFRELLGDRLMQKSQRADQLKGGPYPGGYIVVVFTDEPMLDAERVARFLQGHAFSSVSRIDRAYLLLSYDPSPRWGCCPCFELNLVRNV